VDPKILREYFDRLPDIRKLALEGAFLPLRTTNPPESPVAWATFATGLNPGGHGIFDFVRRDPKGPNSYLPLNGMVDRVPPELGLLAFPIRPPKARNRRSGEGFWAPVARAGYKVSILRMPLTFPPRDLRGGELLAGLGVPDLRATNGSYTLFAAGVDAWEGHTEFGGRHLKIYPRKGEADSILEGTPDPRAPISGRRLSVPLRFTFTGETAAVTIDGGPAASLEPGRFGPWMTVRFSCGPFIRLEGLVRFLLLKSGKDPAIYASPIQIAPYSPPLPISSPKSFAGAMAERLGPMKTAGWPEDTFAANDGVLDDVLLFYDIKDTYRSHERLCLDRLDRSDAALLSCIFTAPDRVQHMYFRYRDKGHPGHDIDRMADFRARTGVEDPIFESYRWMNDTIAAVRSRLDERDILIVVSDHGFLTWRWGVNLNSWLRQEGYLSLMDDGAPGDLKTLNSFFTGRSETAHIDWEKTRAYALGLGQIYLNVKGRESHGTVEPAKADALIEEIKGKLLKLQGPDGREVFTHIYRGEEIFFGPKAHEAPDMQVGFSEGYRISWQSVLLGVTEKIFEPNLKAWSGDHCSYDAKKVPGILLCSKKLIPRAQPGLEDIAPTVCELFNVPAPKGANGVVIPLLLKRP
jgi:predicted AlkP superfamily phosphohydrolase/phosphomutase